jgi:hypothetical protein
MMCRKSLSAMTSAHTDGPNRNVGFQLIGKVRGTVCPRHTVYPVTRGQSSSRVRGIGGQRRTAPLFLIENGQEQIASFRRGPKWFTAAANEGVDAQNLPTLLRNALRHLRVKRMGLGFVFESRKTERARRDDIFASVNRSRQARLDYWTSNYWTSNYWTSNYCTSVTLPFTKVTFRSL